MIIVDVETTGIDAYKNSIVSIGAVEFEKPKNQFYGECRKWEGAEVNPVALEINGFTLEQITDTKKQSLEELMKKFINWTSEMHDMTFAGQNPSFDVGFLSDSAQRYGLGNPLPDRERHFLGKVFGKRVIDLHSCICFHYKSRGLHFPLKNRMSSVNSEGALNYVGLPPEPKPHNALVGAKIVSEAFSRLISGKSLFPEFEKYTIPDYLIKTNA